MATSGTRKSSSKKRKEQVEVVEDNVQIDEKFDVQVDKKFDVQVDDEDQKLMEIFREKLVNGTITDGEAAEYSRLISRKK